MYIRGAERDGIQWGVSTRYLDANITLGGKDAYGNVATATRYLPVYVNGSLKTLDGDYTVTTSVRRLNQDGQVVVGGGCRERMARRTMLPSLLP